MTIDFKQPSKDIYPIGLKFSHESMPGLFHECKITGHLITHDQHGFIVSVRYVVEQKYALGYGTIEKRMRGSDIRRDIESAKAKGEFKNDQRVYSIYSVHGFYAFWHSLGVLYFNWQHDGVLR